ncbi:MAG: RtcB family protein [Nitrospirota bacterium]
MDLGRLKKISDFIWELPATGAMRVPGRLFAAQELVEKMDEKVREQMTNVAALPGIQGASMAMPDAHWGYGFPIGGVAAFDPDEGGIICVGGVGFDISCGVRAMRTAVTREEIAPKIQELTDALFTTVPAGVGSEGKIHLTSNQIDEVLVKGARWAVEKGYGSQADLEYVEERGCLEGADPSCVSETAKKRQHREMGTLGSGNHYLEIQYVDEIYDEAIAKTFGLFREGVVVSIHCGSRALGHQIGTDYLKTLGEAARRAGLVLPDRELASAPIRSIEGERYYKAMVAGINCALANRQVISHLVTEVFDRIAPKAKIALLYDVSHNTCKIEEHEIEGKRKRVYVHRKGATRSFGPGRPEVPEKYRHVGQPVLIGGTMGTASYILAGTTEGMKLAYGSACHGAGRAMSRNEAKRRWHGRKLIDDLAGKGIVIRAHSFAGAAEEAPGAYKDVSAVVDSAHYAGLARKVARLRPLACVKG